MKNKRQVTITISVQDVKDYFECDDATANRIWDRIDDEEGIEENLNEATMAHFNIMMYDMETRLSDEDLSV